MKQKDLINQLEFYKNYYEKNESKKKLLKLANKRNYQLVKNRNIFQLIAQISNNISVSSPNIIKPPPIPKIRVSKIGFLKAVAGYESSLETINQFSNKLIKKYVDEIIAKVKSQVNKYVDDAAVSGDLGQLTDLRTDLGIRKQKVLDMIKSTKNKLSKKIYKGVSEVYQSSIEEVEALIINVII